MRAYEECLAATSTDEAPWYVVPADDKQNARLIVSQIVRGFTRRAEDGVSEDGAERRRELLAIRKRLVKH